MSYSMSTEVQNKLKEIVLKNKSLSEAQGEVLKVQAEACTFSAREKTVKPKVQVCLHL